MKVNDDVLKLLKEKEYFKQEYNENSWDDICKRVSKAIASPEESAEMKEKVESEVFNAMSNLEFIFSTPVLLNADVNSPGQLSSCISGDTLILTESLQSCTMSQSYQKCKIYLNGKGVKLNGFMTWI